MSLVRGNIFHHGAPCPCDPHFIDCYSGVYKDMASHPCSVFQLYRFRNETEMGIIQLMAACTQIGVLGDHTMVADHDAVQTVQLRMVSNP